MIDPVDDDSVSKGRRSRRVRRSRDNTAVIIEAGEPEAVHSQRVVKRFRHSKRTNFVVSRSDMIDSEEFRNLQFLLRFVGPTFVVFGYQEVLFAPREWPWWLLLRFAAVVPVFWAAWMPRRYFSPARMHFFLDTTVVLMTAVATYLSAMERPNGLGLGASFVAVAFARAFVYPQPWYRQSWSFAIGCVLLPTVFWFNIPPAWQLIHDGTLTGFVVFAVIACVIAAGFGHRLFSIRDAIESEQVLLGNYVLKTRIASGGMGDVWLGFSRSEKIKVAIKFLRFERDTDDFKKRFQREIRMVKQLSASSLTARFIDAGTAVDGSPFFVMEYIDGISLREWIESEGPMSEQQTIKMMKRVADMLAHAHRYDIVHRDIKPDNIIIPRGEGPSGAKVIDFGVARPTKESTMTGMNELPGTLGYIAPEVMMGLASSPASDVFSWGAVLFYALTGRRALPGKDPTEVLLRHTKYGSPQLSHQTEISPALDELVSRCLDHVPEDRFADGTELCEAIAAIADESTSD